MKSIRRHELQHNVLDAELAKIVGFFKKHGTKLSWAVLILALIALGWVWWTRKADAQKMQVQNQYNRLTQLVASSETYDEELINGFKSLSEQDTVRWVAADSLLKLGRIYATLALLANEKTRQDEAIPQARKYYQRVINGFGDFPPFVAAANVGLGKLAEGKGDFETARGCYKTVLDMPGLAGYPILQQAREAAWQLGTFQTPVRLATTMPAWARAELKKRQEEESATPENDGKAKEDVKKGDEKPRS